MATQTHVLIDAGQSVVRDDVMFGDGGIDSRIIWKLLLRQCRGGRSDGVHVVTLDNGAMSIDVLPTRGMGIWRVKRGNKTLGWQAPVREPVNPAFVPLMEPAGLGWFAADVAFNCRTHPDFGG